MKLKVGDLVYVGGPGSVQLGMIVWIAEEQEHYRGAGKYTDKYLITWFNSGCTYDYSSSVVWVWRNQYLKLERTIHE